MRSVYVYESRSGDLQVYRHFTRALNALVKDNGFDSAQEMLDAYTNNGWWAEVNDDYAYVDDGGSVRKADIIE